MTAMDLFGLACVVLFSASCLWVGGRLLGLALRTRKLPEGAIGGAFFLSGGLGYGALISAITLADTAPAWASRLVILSALALALAWPLTALFIQRVFRPGAAWAVALVAAVVAGQIGFTASMIDLVYADVPLADVFVSRLWARNSWIAIAVQTWGAFESFAHARALVRRRRIGLAEPIVVNRIQLFGWIMTGAAANMLPPALYAIEPDAFALRLWIAASGLAVSVAMVLAFHPNERYGAWVRDRAERRDAAFA